MARTIRAACSMAETASRGRLPWPGRPCDREGALQQAPLGDAQLQIGGLGDQAGVPVDQSAFEEGPGPEPATSLLVRHQVKHHVTRSRPPGAIEGREGTDGGRDAAFHIGGAPPVHSAVVDAGIEGVAAPRLRRHRDHVEMSVDDQGRTLARAVGVREGCDQGKAPGGRLDLGPDRTPAVERGPDHVLDRTFVARRITSVDGDQGRGQTHHFVDIHVGTHGPSLTGSQPVLAQGESLLVGPRWPAGRGAAILDFAMPPPATCGPPPPASSSGSVSGRGRRRDPVALLEAARAGDKGSLGRLLSLVERGGEPARRVGQLTFAPSAGVDHVVGITGAPGSGKSTLTDRLISVGGRRRRLRRGARG